MSTEPTPETPVADPKATAPAASDAAATPARMEPSSSTTPAEAPGSSAPAAPGETPATPAKPKASAADLLRIAKAEKAAADARNEAEAARKQLAEHDTLKAEIDALVKEGKLLEAARKVFPDDPAMRDRLYWQLNDEVLAREPVVLTEEQKIQAAVAKALADEKKAETDRVAAEKKAADEKAEADQAANLTAERDNLFKEFRQVLSSKAAEFPTVMRHFISGELSQDKLVGHVEAIALAIMDDKTLVSDDDRRAKLVAETAPDVVFAALEQILAPPPAPKAPTTLEELTEAAVRRGLANSRPSTISSTALQAAPPVPKKDPKDMSRDELTAWAIEQAEKRAQARSAG